MSQTSLVLFMDYSRNTRNKSVGKFLIWQKNVRPNDSENLKGYKNCFRVTSGEYRIIYTFTPDDVRVLEVGPRDGDAVYKSFDRKYKNLIFAA